MTLTTCMHSHTLIISRIINIRVKIYILTRLALLIYTRLSVNRDMVKHYEALRLLTTPVYVFALPTHVTASLLSTGLFITRY